MCLRATTKSVFKQHLKTTATTSKLTHLVQYDICTACTNGHFSFYQEWPTQAFRNKTVPSKTHTTCQRKMKPYEEMNKLATLYMLSSLTAYDNHSHYSRLIYKFLSSFSGRWLSCYQERPTELSGNLHHNHP